MIHDDFPSSCHFTLFSTKTQAQSGVPSQHQVPSAMCGTLREVILIFFLLLKIYYITATTTSITNINVDEKHIHNHTPTHRIRVPSIRYYRSSSFHTDYSPHVLQGGVWGHAVVVWGLILLADGGTAAAHFPQNQPQGVHVGTLVGIKLTAVHCFIEHLVVWKIICE